MYFKQFSVAGFAAWAATLPPCVIGLEACSSARHWGRCLAARGHTPRLMAAEHVTPFRLSRGAKNDRNDAQAIPGAVRQPGMRFVTVKSEDQQAMGDAGIVPAKTRLGVITKRGDTYLRGLLTQGARSTLQAALKREPLKRSRLEQWIVALHGRIGYHKTLVAIANKHLRTVWAILAHGEDYDPNAWRRHPHIASRA